jgi:hypothetical protein
MTSNRRRKAETRAHQAATGVPYMVARRQITELTPVATPPVAATARVNILPPLAGWTRPHSCQWWAKTSEQHGPLIALTISLDSRESPASPDLGLSRASVVLFAQVTGPSPDLVST